MKNKANVLVLIAVLALAFTFLAVSCVFQLRFTETATLSTLGRPGKALTRPGLYFKAPSPFQRVHIFDRRVQLLQGKYRELMSEDGLNLVTRFYVAWAVSDPNRFYERVGFRLEDGEKILSGLMEKHATDVMSRTEMSNIVAVRKDDAPNNGIQAVENEILEQVAEESADYGISASAVGLEHLELPETITKAVFARMRAERERKTEKIRSEGQRDAQVIRNLADQAKAEKLSEAEASAMKIRGEGETEAFSHFKVFAQDPEFAMFLRKLEALEETLKTKTTIILDRDVAPYDLLDPSALKMDNEKQADRRSPDLNND